MSIFNPRGWFSKPTPTAEFKASAAGSVISHRTVGRAQWTERNFYDMAREAYKMNPVGYRCAKMISTNAASMKWLLHDTKGNEITEHALLDLLGRPNPMAGTNAFMEAFYSFLLLSGNSYLESAGPDNKPPLELWTHRPDRMKVIAGAHGMPEAYEYSMGTGRKKTWQVDPLTGKGPMLHVKEFNPIDDWYGMSRAEAAAYGVDRHNSAAAHNKALLDNGARPSGALVFKPVTGANMAQPSHAPQAIIENAERDLKERHGGAENAGLPMVFGGNVEWQEMGLSPKDMDFGESKNDAARDICVAWGVPHVLIVKGAATFNNIKEAKLELYEDSVLPTAELVATELNNWLTPMFGDGLRLSHDLDAISALEPRRESKRKSTTELLAKGVIDANEAREMLQYGPRESGVVQKVEATVLTALVKSVSLVGMQPLVRYMKSVGLFDEGMTEEAVIQAALDLVDTSDLGDESGNEEDDNNEEDENNE